VKTNGHREPLGAIELLVAQDAAALIAACRVVRDICSTEGAA